MRRRWGGRPRTPEKDESREGDLKKNGPCGGKPLYRAGPKITAQAKVKDLHGRVKPQD